MNRQTHRFIRIILPSLILASLITLSIRFVSGSQFRLQNIYIVGQQEILKDQKWPRQENLFFINTQNLEKELLKNPYIQEVTVKKEYPNSLRVYVIQRSPQLKWISESGEKYLSSDGVVLLPLSSYSGNYPLLNCTAPYLTQDSPQLKFLLSFLSQLKAMEDFQVKEIICKNSNRFEIYDNRLIVVVDAQKDPMQLATSLLFLLKQFRIEGKYPPVVDLRFDKPVLREALDIISEEATPAASGL